MFSLVLKNKSGFFFFASCFLLAFSAQKLSADSVRINKRPKMQMMGGAGAATYGDKDSAIMNPAALTEIEGTDWQLFPLTIELPFNLDGFNAALDYNDKRGQDDDATQVAESQAALEKFLREVGSSTYRTRINLYPSYTRKYMHIGLMLEALADADFRVNGLGSSQLVSAGDTAITGGLFLAGAYPFLNNSLSVGATLKPLVRNSPLRYQDQRVLDILRGDNPGVDTMDQIFADDIEGRTSFGVGLDLGAKYFLQDYGYSEGRWGSFVKQWKPSIGLTYQDVGNTRFLTDDPLPANIPQSLSLGFAVQPSYKFVDITAAFDFRSINQKEELMNKIHFGFEAMVWNFWAIRGGMSQGYMTGGMGIDVPFFELDVYVSAEEAGEYSSIDDVRTIGVRLSAAL